MILTNSGTGFAATTMRLFGAFLAGIFAFFGLWRFVIPGQLPAARYVPLRRGRIHRGHAVAAVTAEASERRQYAAFMWISPEGQKY